MSGSDAFNHVIFNSFYGLVNCNEKYEHKGADRFVSDQFLIFFFLAFQSREGDKGCCGFQVLLAAM
jgi:hypothetical protein